MKRAGSPAPAYAALGERSRIPPLWAQPLVLLLLFVAAAVCMGLATFGLGAWAAINGRFVDPTFFERWWAALSLTLALFTALSAVTLLWVRKAERRKLRTAGLVRPRWGDLGCWLVGAVWAALLAGLLMLVAGQFPGEGPSAREAAAPPLVALAVALGSTVVVAVLATSEEILFRGWALSAASFKLGPVWALVLTSAAFGAAHVFPWEWADPARLLSFLSFAAMGVAFGAVALKRGSLWSAAAFHTGYNSGLVLLSAWDAGFRPSVMWEGVAEAGSGFDDLGPAAALLAGQALLAVAAVLYWRIPEERRRALAAQARFSWRSRPRSSSSAR